MVVDYQKLKKKKNAKLKQGIAEYMPKYNSSI
jgi:hypothetical protein